MKKQGPFESASHGRSPVRKPELSRRRKVRRPSPVVVAVVVVAVLLAALASLTWFGPPSVRTSVVAAFRSVFAHAEATPAPTSTPEPTRSPTTSPTTSPAPTLSPSLSPSPSPTPMPVSTPVPTITPRPTTAAFTKLPAVNTAKILYRPDLSKYVGQPKSSTSLDGITVFVDAGHGGYTTSITDVGATYAGVKEASVNWQVAQKVKADLEAWGAHVIMTRTADDQFRSLHYRVARVAQEVFRIHKQLVGGSDLTELERLEALFTPSLLLNTDSYSGNGRSVYKGLGARPDLRTILDIENQHKDIVFVALHCNSLPTSTKVHGLSVYWASRNAIFNDELALSKNSSVTDKYPLNPSYQFYDDTARRKFAIELRDRILALCPDLAVPDARDGQIPEGNYAVLREENVVSALVEMGYLTNAADSALLTSDEYQTKIAQGVADGIYAYYCS